MGLSKFRGNPPKSGGKQIMFPIEMFRPGICPIFRYVKKLLLGS